jgi:acylphosphatase
MKKGAVPELNYKWWSKNKAKTMGKSGLGKALKDYEVAQELNDPKRMLKALAEVVKKVGIAQKACNSRAHKETLAALKKYPDIIKKRAAEIKKQAAAPSKSAPAPKPKSGNSAVLWKWDVSKQVLSQYNPDWLENFKGYELKLSLNGDILKILKKEGDYVTPQQMIEDAQEVGKEVVAKLVKELKDIDASSKGKSPQEVDKIRARFKPVAEKIMHEKNKKIEKIPKARWEKFVARKTQYNNYKVDAKLEVSIGVLGTAGAALGIVGSGGAGLALGIVALVRSVAGLAKQINDLAKEAEGVEKTLEKDLDTLMKRYRAADGTAKKTQGRDEVAGSVLKGILGTDAPFLATLPKCSDNYKLWDNKVAGLAVSGRKLSAHISKGIAACDKLEKNIRKAESKEARKILEKLRKGRKALDSSLNQCSTMMGRVSKADANMPKLEKVLKALEGSNPRYADIFDKVFPAVVNLTVSGASAGVGFSEASKTLEYVNISLGLFNDIAAEGESALKEYLG